jgi:integrase/recombinase XerD
MNERARIIELEGFRIWLSAERGRATSTVSGYRRDVANFFDWLDSSEEQLLTPQESDITAYVAHLNHSDLAPSTVKRATVAIRSFFRYLATERQFETDPGASVEVPNVPRGLPKALTLQEVESLLASPVGDDPAAYRDRAILEVLYGCGLRIAELVGLSDVDVDLEGELLRVLGKGRRERIVPLGGQANQAVSQWMSGVGRDAVLSRRTGVTQAEEALFLSTGGPRRGTRLSRQGAWLIVQGHGNRVGLGAELTPHVLRHSCATHMLEDGADIRYVQELLGHRSISDTQRYTSFRDKKIRQIYDRSHPRAERVLQQK